MSSHLPTHKSFLHIKCIIHWPNCTRLTRQIWGKLKPTYIIPTVQVDTLTNSKAAEPRRPSLNLLYHYISSSQSSNIIFTIIKVVNVIDYSPYWDRWRPSQSCQTFCWWWSRIWLPGKSESLMRSFFLIYHLGSPVRSWKRFHWFFPARLLHCGNVPAAIINGKEKERRGCLIRINQHHWDTEQCCKM